ncbi:hypothetical protein [Chryseobacterium proteolyticum]|uniref:hypothetical protein n=1 Tax=Chryseobacterium proteolyticum TaxID=118127 RepID=UPI0039833380
MKASIYLLFSVILIIISCAGRPQKEKAEILYFGGTILTMEDTLPQAEAVVLKKW